MQLEEKEDEGDDSDGDDGDDEDDDDSELEEDAWLMTPADKVWLQCGWLLLFIAMVLCAFLYTKLDDFLLRPAPQQGPSRNVTWVAGTVEREVRIVDKAAEFLYGEGVKTFRLNCATISLSILNFYTFCVLTEAKITKGYHFNPGINPFASNAIVELLSFIIFSGIFVARLASISSLPDWSHYGVSAPLRYSLTNPYSILEAIALLTTLIALPGWLSTGEHRHLNLLWFFFFRVIEMMDRAGSGLGMKKLTHMITDDGRLLCTAFVFGIVVWLVMSSLYFVSNRSNTQKDAVWQSAWYNDGGTWKKWRKFESIPSSMWFVLINLVKEHPLADAHTTFVQRLWVCVVCIFAMPLFALPASILQHALFKRDEEADENDSSDEEEVVGARPGESVIMPQASTNQTMLQGLEAVPVFYRALCAGFLSYGSILAYFFYTARHSNHNYFCFVRIVVRGVDLLVIDSITSFAFFLVWLYHAWPEGRTYCFSGLGIIDFLAWFSGFLHIIVFAAGGGEEVWEPVLAACVLRVFKMERYLHSFADLASITWENKSILTAALLLSTCLWAFLSMILYVTERGTADEEMFEQYGSMMRSPWAEIINLHGEWPWADYTAAGKGVGCGIALLGIMIFCVPISIFGEGFRQKLQKEQVKSEMFDQRPWQQLYRPVGDGIKQQLYDVLYAHLHCQSSSDLPRQFRMVRAVSSIMVTVQVFVTLVGSVGGEEWLINGISCRFAVWWFCYALDWITTLYFLAEFTARCVALGWRHPCSAIGLADGLSLAAQLTTVLCNPSPTSGFRERAFRPDYQAGFLDDLIVPLRLMRLFALESYLLSFHTLKNVLALNRAVLVRSGGALVATWFVHATILYLLERPASADPLSDLNDVPPGPLSLLNGQHKSGSGGLVLQEDDDDGEGEDDLEMHQRYDSILRALQYSIVHLFGDYPETDYTFASKVVHFGGIMGGIAIIAVFTGVFSASFVDYVRDQRSNDLKDLKYRQLMACTKVAKALQRAYRSRKSAGLPLCAKSSPPTLSAWAVFTRDVVSGRTRQGRNVMLFFNLVLLVNVLKTIVASMPEFDQPRLAWAEALCHTIEALCTAIFIFEYVVRVSGSPKTAGRRVRFGWQVFNFVCLFPGMCELLFAVTNSNHSHPGLESLFEAMAMIRVVRVLGFPLFHREVVMIERALVDAGEMLGVPAYLALVLWINTSSHFMWLENYYKEEGGTWESMTSVPAAMYWCCIFLTGEWANVDFTYAGSRLCIFYVLFGVAMFSIPVGIIVEAVGSTIKLVATEEADVKEMCKIDKSQVKRQTVKLLQQGTRDPAPQIEMSAR